MSDDRVRRAERERDRLPCRETFEAVDRERARAGDGPWLPIVDSVHMGWMWEIDVSALAPNAWHRLAATPADQTLAGLADLGRSMLARSPRMRAEYGL